MNAMRSFFGGGNTPGLPGIFGNIQQFGQRISSFFTNPLGALLGMNFNIPPNLQNNYEGIAKYLVSSGQMTPEQLEQCKQLAVQWGPTIEKFLPRR